MEIDELAEEIYYRIFGFLDDYWFYAGKTQEIVDWLMEIDLDGISVEQLVDWWCEYDADV